MKRSLVLATKLHSITQSRLRPEEERTWSIDIDSFTQRDFSLAPNNSEQSNIDSAMTFQPIRQFLSFYSPKPVELMLDNLVLPNCKGVFILSSALTTFRVRNLATDKSIVCSVIFA